MHLTINRKSRVGRGSRRIRKKHKLIFCDWIPPVFSWYKWVVSCIYVIGLSWFQVLVFGANEKIEWRERVVGKRPTIGKEKRRWTSKHPSPAVWNLMWEWDSRLWESVEATKLEVGLLGFWVMRKKRLMRNLNDLDEGLYMELLDGWCSWKSQFEEGSQWFWLLPLFFPIPEILKFEIGSHFLTILDTSVFYLFTRKRTAKNEIACFFAGFCISRDCKQWLPIKGAKLH